MSDCIFCKIAVGEIPSATVYEDEDFRVILDLNPASCGHALVIPKQHYENLMTIPEDLAGKAMITAKKVATVLKEVLPCDGYNILQNNGLCAGQTVFHFHIHLIPRRENDNVGLEWNHMALTDAMRDEILKKVEGKF